MLTLASAKGKCDSDSTKVTLGARGKRGVAGAPGEDGQQGVPGVAGSPGAPGAPGANGVVDGYYHYAANPAFDKGADLVVLDTMPTLPAGKYMLSGNVWLKSDQTAVANVDCFLEPEDSLDVFDEAQTTVFNGSSQIDVPLEAVASSDVPFSPLIECNNGNAAVFAEARGHLRDPGREPHHQLIHPLIGPLVGPPSGYRRGAGRRMRATVEP